jgi:hypothetical protein
LSAPTIRDVMAQVEFELAQGLVARPDLRRAIRELRGLHERTRGDLFGDEERRIDVREALSRQFQINDMILAILGEAVEAAQDARVEARRVHGYLQQALEGDEPVPTDAGAAAKTAGRAGDDGGAAADATESAEERSPWEPELDPLAALDDLDGDPGDEVEWAMRPERLWLTMDQRPPRLPLVGSLLRRFRTALHTRVLIYAGQLGDKQSAVNRILGDHLLRLVEVARAQTQAIDSIRIRLHRLEALLERRRRAP